MHLNHPSSNPFPHLPHPAGQPILKNSKVPPVEPWVAAHLKTIPTLSSLTHFSYAVDVARNVVVHYNQVQEYLGYSPELNPGFLQCAFHPEERATLHNLTLQMQKCLRRYPTAPPYYTFITGHRLKKSNGDFLKVLRYTQPVWFDLENNLLILNNLCMDVSSHKLETGITFDVQLPPQVTHSRSEVLHFFHNVFAKAQAPFSPRELSVLKTLVSFNSIRAAAEQLAITERTFETHLKNIRKKVDMNRTMDVVLLAMSKGWI